MAYDLWTERPHCSHLYVLFHELLLICYHLRSDKICSIHWCKPGSSCSLSVIGQYHYHWGHWSIRSKSVSNCSHDSIGSSNSIYSKYALETSQLVIRRLHVRAYHDRHICRKHVNLLDSSNSCSWIICLDLTFSKFSFSFHLDECSDQH